jgi:hypothetical protein
VLAGPVWLPLSHPSPQPAGRLPQRLSLARLALLWPHQPGRDHTATPLTTPLAQKGRGTDAEPGRGGTEFAAPAPVPPPATPHPARG